VAARHKLVVRFKQWYDPAMEARFAREPDVELVTVEREGDPNLVWERLSQAHAFQVSSAKDELPKQWFVTDDLLARCPNLLCVSSNGAGYDTIDVQACTRAGVLVVNQAGGNAQSVAEHAIGLMLDVTRRISENDRLLRTERGFTREDIMGYEMSGRVLGLVGIGHIGTRVAKLARAFDMEVLAVDPYLTEEEIARRGATALGIEYNADLVTLSKRRAADAGVTERASFLNADVFVSDFSKADVLTLFLLPSLNLRLRPQILDMRPGTRVVSNSFTMGDWEADKQQRVEGCTTWCNALLWIVPAKVDGSWEMPDGVLRLEQHFQHVTGELGATPIAEGHLVGDGITFSVGDVQYGGRVNGGTIEGTMSGARTGNWRATRQ